MLVLVPHPDDHHSQTYLLLFSTAHSPVQAIPSSYLFLVWNLFKGNCFLVLPAATNCYPCFYLWRAFHYLGHYEEGPHNLALLYFSFFIVHSPNPSSPLPSLWAPGTLAALLESWIAPCCCALQDLCPEILLLGAFIFLLFLPSQQGLLCPASL